MPPGDHAFLFEVRQWVRPPRAPRALQRAYRGQTGGVYQPDSLIGCTLCTPIMPVRAKILRRNLCQRLGYVLQLYEEAKKINCPGPRSHGRAPPLRLQYSSHGVFWEPLTLLKKLKTTLRPQGLEIMRRIYSFGMLRRFPLAIRGQTS
ncbi:hypothetical protein F4819DRAFT_91596 [Hypoxylon fuscum]|nr:hypothetical protein F4819DRAFT_91596 [Hypoxylon fuscum]